MTASVETPADYGAGQQGEAKRWISEIQLALKDREKWCERGRKIYRRYEDKRDYANEGNRRLNILWSNVETLKPTLYARTPKPEVSRRYKDADPVGRLASEILERCTSFTLEDYDFDGTMQLCVLDYLLPGRGQAWVRYVPTYGEPVTDPLSGAPLLDDAGQPIPSLKHESVACDYVYWTDFLTNPARTWSEVRWAARRHYFTREECRKEFGKEIGDRVPLDHRPPGVDKDDPQKVEAFAKATVWELWDKVSRKQVFIHTAYGESPLLTRDDPLGLKDFFPCPRPMTATVTTDSIIPIPDFALYQDQAEELDDLTARIALLQKALKVAGVYDSAAGSLQSLLSEGAENIMVPVDSWAAFAEKGGLKGSVDFLPIDMIAATLVSLYEARERVKQDLYEITGLSDILRGASDPNETATAQGIKAQWGSIRVRDRQKEVQRFARDLIRIKAELIAEKFQPETIAKMAGVEQMGQDAMQAFPMAVELLRNEPMRSFRIDIETDSTIEPDEQQEKMARTEFLTAVGGFMQQSIGVLQAAPELAPMMGEMLMFGVRGFRVARQLETVIEQSMQAVVQRATNPQPPQPDPVQMAEAENEKARLMLDAKKAEQDFALGTADLNLRAAELQQNGLLDAAALAQDPKPQVVQ